MAYTTPAYTSFDITRSVTLTYSSARAYPMGFVQIDAGLNVGNNPAGLSIQLVRNSQTVPLSNGADKAEYQWSGSIGTSRLAAQFDARTLGGANAYSYSVIADAWWSNGNHHPAPAQSARVLIIDEQNSPFGAGWSIAGLQRLVLNGVNADSIVLIDGSGTASFFASCGFRCWTSPKGDYSALSFDGTYYWRKFADSTMERFSSTGRLLAIRNRFNDSTTYGYDASNRLTSITDPAGKVTTLAYSGDGSCTLGSAAGKLCRITTPGGRTTQVRVNASGDLDRIDDPDTTALSMTYTNHLLTQWTNRSNATTNLTYDGFNQVKTIEAASITTDQGVIRPTTSIVSLDSATLAPIGSGYALRQRVLPENAAVTETAPKGTVTKTLSYRSGMPIQVDVRDPSGKHYLTTYTYDDSTRLSQVVNPSGGATVYHWEQSRLKSVEDLAAGTSTVYKYNTHYAQLDTMWVNGKFVQHNIYLASPYAYKVPDTVEVNNPGVVGNNKTTYSYDVHGRVLTAIDPEQHQASIAYESAGTFQNQSNVTVNGRTTSYAHDSYGRVYQVTDPASRTLTVLYDALNRDTSVAGPLGKRVRKTYSDGTGTYEVYDPKGQRYTTYVNALGWVTQKTDPRTASEYFTYDKHGNVVTYLPRRGSAYQVTFKYDTLDRVKERTANNDTTRFAYDTANKWMAASNAEATDTVFTDPDNRTTSAHSWRNGIRYEVNTGYSPDGTQGQKAVRGYNGSSQAYFGFTTSFASDTLLRPVTVQDPVPKSTSITYNKDNLPYVITLPTGTTTAQHLQLTNSYNSAHALQQVSFNQALDYSLGRIYGYDVLERQSTRDKGTSGDTYRRTVQYDDFGRLTGYTDTHIWEEEIWTCPGLTEDDCYWDYLWHDDPIRSDSYSYDDAGNRTDRGAAAATSGNRISNFDGFSLVYDDDNNITNKSKSGVTNQAYTWNGLGQLTQVVVNGVTTTYGYDGFGRRVRKTVNGVTTRYLWDGSDLLVELDGSGTPIREYSYYPGIDRPHAIRIASGGAVYYYAMEKPGHVVGLVNSSNSLVNSYEYDPYGGLLSSSETVPQPFKFAGRELDAETGLYYMRARYYDPQLARFLTEDPLGISVSSNLFAYVGNDPINATDPSGQCPVDQQEPVENEKGEIVGYKCKLGALLPPIDILADPFHFSDQVMRFVNNLMDATDKLNKQSLADLRQDLLQAAGLMESTVQNSVCSGGGFVLAGGGKDLGKWAHGGVYVIPYQWDSKTGSGSGFLLEGSIKGLPLEGAYEGMWNYRTRTYTNSGLAIASGEWNKTSWGPFSAGGFANTRDVGGFAMVGPVGAGGYANVPLSGECK